MTGIEQLLAVPTMHFVVVFKVKASFGRTVIGIFQFGLVHPDAFGSELSVTVNG